MSKLGKNMWTIFAKRSADLLYKAGRNSMIEAGRASTATGIVLGGIYLYNSVTSAYQPSVFKPLNPPKIDAPTPRIGSSPSPGS